MYANDHISIYPLFYNAPKTQQTSCDKEECMATDIPLRFVAYTESYLKH